jgi:thiamine transport system permease protein
VGVAAVLFAYGRYQRRNRTQFNVRAISSAQRTPKTRRERAMVYGIIGSMVLLLGVPMLTLVVRSLRVEGGLGTANYQALLTNPTGSALFIPPGTALTNSLKFAVAATLIAIVIGMLATATIVYRRGPIATGFDAMLMLPLGASSVTLGLGLLIALDEPFDLRTSIWLIPIAHALVAIPFVVRTSAPLMHSVRTSLREVASVLGASPAGVWRTVDLPIAARAALVGAAFAFAISLGEFGATAFLVRPLTGTLPTAIYRLLGVPGTAAFGRAMAMATVLMLVTAVAVLAIERLRIGHLGDF